MCGVNPFAKRGCKFEDFNSVLFQDNCIHVVQSSCASASLVNFYFDECSLLNDLTVADSSKYVLSAVTISDMNIAHRRPLTLAILDISVLLALLLIANDYEVPSSWSGDCITSTSDAL